MPISVRVKTVRADKASRKNKIVQAALKCFMKSGVAQTKMSEVAEKAGVDQPLIHYYFPNLDSLYSDVVNAVLEHLKEHMLTHLLRNSKDSKAVLEAYISTYFDWARDHHGYFSVWMYFYYLATYNPTFAQLNTLIRETGRTRIQSILYEGIERGTFKIPPGIKVSELAIGIQGIITGNVILAGTESNPDWETIRKATIQLGLHSVGIKTDD